MIKLLASFPPARNRQTIALKSAGIADAEGPGTGPLSGDATAPISRNCASVESMPVAPTAAQQAPRNLRRLGSKVWVLGFMAGRGKLFLDGPIGRGQHEIDGRPDLIRVA